jgi:hypothetical protein
MDNKPIDLEQKRFEQQNKEALERHERLLATDPAYARERSFKEAFAWVFINALNNAAYDYVYAVNRYTGKPKEDLRAELEIIIKEWAEDWPRMAESYDQERNE